MPAMTEKLKSAGLSDEQIEKMQDTAKLCYDKCKPPHYIHNISVDSFKVSSFFKITNTNIFNDNLSL